MINTDLWLKVMCGLMINAVLFGVGLVTVLVSPLTSGNLMLWIPVVVVASFLITPFLTGMVAKRMRIRNWGRDGWREGDAISG